MGRVLGEYYTALLVTGTWRQVQSDARIKKGLNVGGGDCRRENADRMSSVRIDCDNAGIKYSKVRLQRNDFLRTINEAMFCVTYTLRMDIKVD